jgi:hypothetical protein
MNRKNAARIRSAIVAAKRGGNHAVGMLFGNIHDETWTRAYMRTISRGLGR